MFLLDTMVVCERTKSRPRASVLAWLKNADPAQQFVSALTIGEIRYGVRRMPPNQHRSRLETWVAQELTPFFAGRVLPVDERVADRWGALRADAARALPLVDSLIAATALVHNLTIASRNERDFAGLGVRVVNPWT